MGQLLNKEALLKGDELKKQKVEFSDGNYVFVREMTGQERDAWEQSMYKPVKGKDGRQDFQPDMKNYKAKLAVCVLCDENGKPLFNFNEYPQLSKSISAKKLEKIVEVAQELNGITEEQKENLSQSSEADQSEDSTSNSVEN